MISTRCICPTERSRIRVSRGTGSSKEGLESLQPPGQIRVLPGKFSPGRPAHGDVLRHRHGRRGMKCWCTMPIPRSMASWGGFEVEPLTAEENLALVRLEQPV